MLESLYSALPKLFCFWCLSLKSQSIIFLSFAVIVLKSRSTEIELEVAF